ncbi:MAG: hypothetical protein AAFQ98_09920 [Bacteroidota bacterium]
MLRRIFFWWRRYRAGKERLQTASSQLFIGEVSKEGFTVERLVGNYARQYHWKALTDVVIDIPKLTLTFHTSRDRSFVVPRANHVGWYKLLHGIPEGYPGFDYRAVKSHLAQMTSCKVCGAMAVFDKVCRACDVKEYQGSYDANSYYKRKQLEYFAQHGGLAYIDLSVNPLDGFAKCPDYQVLVTEEEVLVFRSQENRS